MTQDTIQQCCGSGMFILDPDPTYSIPDPGSRLLGLQDLRSGSASKNLSILTQKTDSKFLKITSGMFFPTTGYGFFSVPDPGVKKATDSGSRISNTEIQHRKLERKYQGLVAYLQLMFIVILAVDVYCHTCS